MMILSHLTFLFCRKVIEGSEVLERIEEEATVNERPLKEIMITDSGDIPVVKP